MAEQQQQGEQRAFGGRRPQGRGGPRRQQKEQWQPKTKLGRLVQSDLITQIEDIFRWGMPIKEAEIIDKLIPAYKEGKGLREECMQVKPVQKQTTAGQRMRFKAYVIVGDSNGHIGLGWNSNKEVQGAIKNAVTHAKLNIVPVRRGYWGNMIGNAHTIPGKVHGKCGSVRVRLIPAPRGTGIVAAPASKRVLQFAGIGDVYTCSSGCTRTRGNFVKATYYALQSTYQYFTPDWRGLPAQEEHPFDKFHDFLKTPVQQQQQHRRRQN